jgi:CrcB protein
MRSNARRSFFMLSYFFVALGGAIGTAARFWISGAAADRFGQTFPFGTLVVNVIGSFVVGAFAALADPDGRWLVQFAARATSGSISRSMKPLS